MAVLGGIAAVMPLARPGRRPLRWVAAAVPVAGAFLLPRGLVAAALVIPFLAACVDDVWRERRWPPAPTAVAAVYATAAASSLLVSRLGLRPLGFHEPIIELTGVHYLYAGVGALTLATATRRRSAILLTMTAPPIVAAGFFTRAAVFQVGGAVLMTAGVWLTALEHLRLATDPSRQRAERILFAASGLAPWVPMVLAVSWAAAQHTAVPALSIPDMVRTHGAANSVGFIVAGLVARRVRSRPLSSAHDAVRSAARAYHDRRARRGPRAGAAFATFMRPRRVELR